MIRKKLELRAYRKRHGLSVVAAGKKLGVAGSTFRSWENGNREMTPEMAVEAERELGIERILLRPDVFRRTAA